MADMEDVSYAIEAHGLVKRFGKTTALAGVDLTARAGRVLGVLGPNGAGKTTAVRILATLLRPDEGSASVCGYDVVRDAHRVRQLIGLTGQYASVDEGLSGTNNLLMIGRLLGLSRAGGPGPGGRAAGAVRAHRRGRAGGEGLLRRHAAAPRPGREPGRPPRRAVPGRADHRARPAQPQRGLGHAPPAGRRRHHGAADHPVPGGSRPARARPGGHRPRPGHRERHPRLAQGAGRAAGARGHAGQPRPTWARSPRCWRPG